MVVNDPHNSARTIAGRYRLGSRLGSSLEAAVFEAFDEQLQRPVVLKLVHPDLSDVPEVQAQFDSLMPIAAALHHPNIAVLHEYGRASWNDRQVLYVASERLVGGSLRDLLDRGRLLSPSQALLVGLDACKALDAMHRDGLLHTDIRPSTLVFGDDRRLRVVDAGLSQVLHGAAGDVTERSVDRAKYASPEEAQGLPVQPKSDVYSLCLALLEAVTGNVPFVGESAVATLANRVDRLMPVSADFGQLAAVFERAGRPVADDRYTAAEFGRALVQSAEQMPRPAPLPIIANSLFGPDSGGTDQPVEPTGPLSRPTAVAVPPEPGEPEPAPAVAVPAGVVPAEAVLAGAVLAETVPAEAVPAEAVPAEAVPAETVPAETVPAEAVPEPPQPVPPTLPSALPPPPPPTAPVQGGPVPPPMVAVPPSAPTPAIAEGGPDDDFDPADEFPEQPPTVGSGRRWFLAVLVVMAVGGGVLAWYSTRPETSVVPDLAGLRQGAALNQIGPFEAMITEEASETVEAGVVIRTEPAGGTTLENGETINIFVSTGPAPRALPELAGLTLADATAQLTQIGLVLIEADPVFDEAVPPGVVVSWSVPAAPTLAAGATVTKGTTVQVVLSAGPAPRTVPDLTGMPVAEATALVQSLGLVAVPLPDEFSSTVPLGSVVRQEPAPATTVERGATVSVVVSKGPDLVAMPVLGGLGYDAIVAALNGAGFAVGTVAGDTTQALQSVTVSGSAVVDGQQFLRGTAVDLTFAPTPEPAVPVV